VTSPSEAALFHPLTINTAPDGSKPVLEQIRRTFGFVPNLMATFANSPAVIKGYLALDAEFAKTFTPVERQLILFAASLENVCPYCTAAHSTMLKAVLNVPAEEVAAIRDEQPTGNIRHDALIALTREIVQRRGHAGRNTVAAFLAAGYRTEQVMELLLGVALKTISNYLDHLSPTTIDPAFAAER
jgi:AhpD family alkylhydroperoxidase